ncbi:porin [Vibrio sp. ER1A]|uniref:porin n=1 Tax=Vibrio sp. ER1A TaxID=1517681 RepID=UPI0004DD3A42|nr:porin [Vibrio sp. ER1A]KFA96680.1 hypothetical protein HW45_22290 [Vibrio sp. ER1A]
MKKTLVALSVLAAAGSAQAIELYNQDKVTVNMTGDVEVVYLQSTDKNDAYEGGFHQEIQDADFGFDTRYAVNDDLQVGAFWEFKGTTDGKVSGTSTGNVYVGLYSQSVGSIRIGKLDTVLDDAGIGSDYQFGIKSFFQNGSKFSVDEAVRYDIDKGTFYFSLAGAQDKNDNSAIGKNGSWIDGKIGGRFADFDISAFAGKAKIDDATPAPSSDESLYAVQGRYEGVENLGLELGYYRVDGDAANPGTDIKTDTFGLAADYTLDAWKFAAGYSRASTDAAGAEDTNNWFVNAGYALAPSTTAYVEFGGTDETDSQTGIAVGLKAEF